MASAVEDAAVVIVDISKRYKESANCRLEGMYALQKEKLVIPMLTERGCASLPFTFTFASWRACACAYIFILSFR